MGPQLVVPLVGGMSVGVGLPAFEFGIPRVKSRPERCEYAPFRQKMRDRKTKDDGRQDGEEFELIHATTQYSHADVPMWER